jgi:hypothetical protein
MLVVSLVVDMSVGLLIAVCVGLMLWFGPIAGGEVRGDGLATLSAIAVLTAFLVIASIGVLALRRRIGPVWSRVPCWLEVATAPVLLAMVVSDLGWGVRHQVWMAHPGGAAWSARLFAAVLVVLGAKLLFAARFAVDCRRGPR